jgi:hypothetical protein
VVTLGGGGLIIVVVAVHEALALRADIISYYYY